jgi:uncharacterized membrane protein
VDCFFHSNVPSVTRCRDCTRPLCATCRDDAGTCPSCRLSARIDAASATRGELPGDVRQGPGPGPQWSGSAPGATAGTHASASASASAPGAGGAAAGQPAPQAQASTAVATVSPETRGLVALGYPFWPLAALALLDPKRTPYVRRQAIQAIGFSFGYYGFSVVLTALTHIPILNLSAYALLPLLIPLYIVAVCVYGFKAWRGDDVRVPLISDWLDQRWGPEGSAHPT